MKRFDLNGIWELSCENIHCKGTIPGSVYSFLLDAGKMEDPYFRDNELKALKLMDQDFCFSREFTLPAGFLEGCKRLILRFQGLDTICRIEINGVEVGTACNMHRVWEYDLSLIHISEPTRH